MLYKASILETETSSSITLAQYLQEMWGVQEASVNIDGTELYVETICIAETSGCSAQKTESLSVGTVVGSAVGAVLGRALLVVTVVIIFKKCNKLPKR